jgi:tRNA modification GTPase
LDALERAIARALTGSESLDPDGVIVSNARHLEALREASAALARVVEAARASSTPDLLAVDLRAAAAALGRITGDDILEGLLDRVFSEFCIGK